MTAVLAVGEWADNAALIADADKLGYISDFTLDLSYGLGRFWTQHRPAGLLASDANPDKGDVTYDVTAAPPETWVGRFGTVVWDGPYRLGGTRDRGAEDDSYGVDVYRNERDTMRLLECGVAAAAACCQKGGHVLVKCQDQVVSGRKVWQTRRLADHGEALGLRLKDQLHLVTRGGRPQPAGRRQIHARSNYSTLLVFVQTKTVEPGVQLSLVSGN